MSESLQDLFGNNLTITEDNSTQASKDEEIREMKQITEKINCIHEWRKLYTFKKKEINYDVFYCVHCLKQTNKKRECPK